MQGSTSYQFVMQLLCFILSSRYVSLDLLKPQAPDDPFSHAWEKISPSAKKLLPKDGLIITSQPEHKDPLDLPTYSRSRQAVDLVKQFGKDSRIFRKVSKTASNFRSQLSLKARARPHKQAGSAEQCRSIGSEMSSETAGAPAGLSNSSESAKFSPRESAESPEPSGPSTYFATIGSDSFPHSSGTSRLTELEGLTSSYQAHKLDSFSKSDDLGNSFGEGEPPNAKHPPNVLAPTLEPPRFEIILKSGVREPTQWERREFHELKVICTKAFSNRKLSFELGNGKEYTMDNFTQLLKTKISSKNPQYEYWKLLSRNVLSDRIINDVEAAWNSLYRLKRDIGFDKTKVENSIVDWIENLDQEQVEKDFRNEREIAIKVIKKSKVKLEKKVEFYFPDIKSMIYNSNSDKLERFANARGIQNLSKQHEEFGNPTFSTVEDIIKTLPHEFDLTTEIYRYLLITGFENILKEIREEADNHLKAIAQKHVHDFLKNTSSIMPHVESYIESLNENDFERHFGLIPSKIYQKLHEVPLRSERIKYAICKNKHSMKKEDVRALKNFSSDINKFRNEIQVMIERYISLGQIQNVEKLMKLKNEAISFNPVNHPYVEHLFSENMIDQSTKLNLNPEKRITKKEFLEIVGTEQEFTALLMSKFRSNLLGRIVNISHTHEFKKELKRKAIKILGETYVEGFEYDAKSFYLTRDAFEKSGGIQFEKALKVYSKKAQKELRSQPDLISIAEALVEAHIHEENKPFYLEQDVSQLLDEMNIKNLQDFSDREGIFRELQSFDERFSVFYHTPLVRGDSRLKGTSFENLTEDSRTKLNYIAKMIYENLGTLNSLYEENSELRKQIARMERNFYQDIPQILEFMQVIHRHVPNVERPLKSGWDSYFTLKNLSFFMTGPKHY
ncbi:hypothetical protein PGTUg99_032241 [Puccinia graminis f. sp. tritici]|uniref:Uncharacterized protein n=1 Tax=Puccinia graminis f. sp. tritici TaxID=56615 RepID=A0A5B0N5I8_PUCGR|nr:hypothetical protein PGTUg99_032241 [Puccinia graminis f. sp. tritici]